MRSTHALIVYFGFFCLIHLTKPSTVFAKNLSPERSGNFSAGSNIHHQPGTKQMTQDEELHYKQKKASLPTGYREIPDIYKDDDGFNESSPVQRVDRSTWGKTTCGRTQNSIEARITDCKKQLGALAEWDGTLKGNAGQGLWKLVTRSGPGKEIWRDERTGLLWSSLVSEGTNWCKASGNTQSHSTATCEPGSENQTKPPISYCAEVEGVVSEVSGESYSKGTYSPAKGGLGKKTTPSVIWRLPTIYDFQQANINGIRFVMPDTGAAGGYEQSSSVYSYFRDYAWQFHSSNGVIGYSSRLNLDRVRCVGR